MAKIGEKLWKTRGNNGFILFARMVVFLGRGPVFYSQAMWIFLRFLLIITRGTLKI